MRGARRARGRARGTTTHCLACFGPWSSLLLFFLVIFVIVWALFDNFTRKDHGGWAKAVGFLFILFLPLLGVFVYLIARPADVDAQGRAAPVPVRYDVPAGAGGGVDRAACPLVCADGSGG